MPAALVTGILGASDFEAMTVPTPAPAIAAHPTQLDQVPLPERLPPIVITAFTRPDLLAPVLAAIAQQTLSPPEIIAYVDGARNDKDCVLIADCVQLLEAFATPDRPVQIRQREQNLGCDRNVIAAFTEVFATHETLVYVEDDDWPNPCFYDRLCRLLAAYRDRPEVFSVSGYVSQSLPVEAITTDFFVTRRVFSWGFGIWRDRWQSMDLPQRSGQYNPFGGFHQIPTTVESKMTLANQFWLEKNQKTDWVITMTLCALAQGKVHVVPKYSIVKNIGFGHAQSETYRGQEGSWVNFGYREDFIPNTLPTDLTPYDALNRPLTGVELAQFFTKKQMWLTPRTLLYYLRRYPDPASMINWLALFVKRLPMLIKRQRAGRLL